MSDQAFLVEIPRRQFHADSIKAAWTEAAAGIIETGRAILAAKEELQHGEFKAMVEEDLPFGVRTAQRLMAISKDAWLSNATHGSHLPPSWRTLYEMTRLDDGQKETLVEQARQNGEPIKRTDVAKLLKTARKAGKNERHGPSEILGATEIIVGDALSALRDIEHADVVITDPVWPNCPEGAITGWDQPYELLQGVMAALPPTVKRVVIVLRSDSDPRFLSAVPDCWPFFNASWLQYVIPGYIGRKLGGNEIAYAFGEPVPSSEGRRVIPCVAPKAQPVDREEVGHPMPRALVHMEWLVEWWSEPGETVLDPFCGSGTIPLAAARMQRHGIGIEVDPTYAEMARKRISESAPLLTQVEAA